MKRKNNEKKIDESWTNGRNFPIETLRVNLGESPHERSVKPYYLIEYLVDLYEIIFFTRL